MSVNSYLVHPPQYVHPPQSAELLQPMAQQPMGQQPMRQQQPYHQPQQPSGQSPPFQQPAYQQSQQSQFQPHPGNVQPQPSNLQPQQSHYQQQYMHQPSYEPEQFDRQGHSKGLLSRISSLQLIVGIAVLVTAIAVVAVVLLSGGPEPEQLIEQPIVPSTGDINEELEPEPELELELEPEPEPPAQYEYITIQGVEFSTSLTELDFGFWSEWEVSNLTDSDIVPLQHMTNLTELNLDGNNVSDLSPLVNLSPFTRLVLEENPNSDWSPVSHIIDVSGRP